ncbi:MAG: ABC transporter permease [Clostridiales bacterium]|nr:ABC transporter permease [Clostridiales bacterium]
MRNIYRSLAGNALSKNKIVYVPYIISAIMMITISHVILAISTDPVIGSIEGGDGLQMIMSIGIFVMYNISFFFLFGVSRFVIKNRKKELGLYSVLGMQKKHIIRVQFLENLAVYLISVASGTVIGIVLSKVIQLGVLKIYHAEADFGWSIMVTPIFANVIAFGAFFMVFFIINSIGILLSNTLEYMKEEGKGEKRPKSNWILAIAGVLLLSFGYYLSFRSQSATKALNLFFFAVMLVIFGTMALFTAGSITLLNALKKNKKYYYKTGHFISVSGMLYRMKRNALTLATISIFATMVLVTLSSVMTLYNTVSTLAKQWYRVDFHLVYDHEDPQTDEERMAKLSAGAEKVGMEISNMFPYTYYNAYAYVTDGLCMCYPNYTSFDACEVFYMSMDAYNQANGTDIELAENEVGVYSLEGKVLSGEICFQYSNAVAEPEGELSAPYKIVALDDAPTLSYGASISLTNGTYFFVFKNYEQLAAMRPYICESIKEYDDGRHFILINSPSDRQTQLAFYKDLNNNQEEYGYTFAYSRIQDIDEVIGIYGGLFFLGIFLSAAFLTITILNMYFSQLQQGYEDSKRFAIMRKVGLTRKEIKKSINSQIVIVFLLPLLVAVIHTMAAYPMVNRILRLFGGCEPRAFLLILALCIAVFAVGYTIAYFFTRRTYLRLVSGTKM